MKLLLAFLPLALLIAALYAVVKVLEARKAASAACTPMSAAPLSEPEPEIGPPPYDRRKQGILTDAELRFLPVLEQAVAQLWNGSARVHVQVPMSAVLQVARGLDNSARQAWQNRIDRKTFDFVICTDRTQVLACVELDDSSHDRPKRRDRDDFVNRACAAAGIHLARIPGSAHYDVEKVAQALAPRPPTNRRGSVTRSPSALRPSRETVAESSEQ